MNRLLLSTFGRLIHEDFCPLSLIRVTLHKVQNLEIQKHYTYKYNIWIVLKWKWAQMKITFLIIAPLLLLSAFQTRGTREPQKTAEGKQESTSSHVKDKWHVKWKTGTIFLFVVRTIEELLILIMICLLKVMSSQRCVLFSLYFIGNSMCVPTWAYLWPES